MNCDKAILKLVFIGIAFASLPSFAVDPTGNSFLDKLNAWSEEHGDGFVRQQLSRTYNQEGLMSEIKTAANRVSHQVEELNRWSSKGADGLAKITTQELTQAVNQYEQLNRFGLRYLNTSNLKGAYSQMNVSSKPGATPSEWKTELEIKIGNEPVKTTEITKEAFTEISKKGLLEPRSSRGEGKAFDLTARAVLSTPVEHAASVGRSPYEQFSNPLDIIGAIR
jgi:hypothetical protein